MDKPEKKGLYQYKCGHCGHVGGCFGNDTSPPWCGECQRSDNITILSVELFRKDVS